MNSLVGYLVEMVLHIISLKGSFYLFQEQLCLFYNTEL